MLFRKKCCSPIISARVLGNRRPNFVCISRLCKMSFWTRFSTHPTSTFSWLVSFLLESSLCYRHIQISVTGFIRGVSYLRSHRGETISKGAISLFFIFFNFFFYSRSDNLETFFSSRGFFQKTNKNTSHISKTQIY